MRKLRHVVLPNQSRIPVTHIANINLRVTHKDGRVNDLEKVRISLVSEPTWEWLLIGRSELEPRNALPEQALYAQSMPPTAPGGQAVMKPADARSFPNNTTEQRN